MWSIWVSRAFTTLIASEGSWPCMADLRAAVKLSTYHREKALHAINLMFHILYYKLSKECHLLYEGSP